MRDNTTRLLLVCIAILTTFFGQIGGAMAAGTGCVAPPDNLAHWWPFDRYFTYATYLPAQDIIGSSDGVRTTNAGTPGKVLHALKRDSTANIPDDSSLHFSNVGVTGITFDAWFFVPDDNVQQSTTSQTGDRIFAKAGGNDVAGGGFLLTLDLNNLDPSSEYYRFEMGDGNGGNYVLVGVPPSGPIPRNTWTHIAVTVTPNQETVVDQQTQNVLTYPNAIVEMYIDGVSIPVYDSVTNTNHTQGTADLNNSFPLIIGEGYLDIDEVEIFNRPLDQSEIQDMVIAGGDGSAGKCKGSFDPAPDPNPSPGFYQYVPPGEKIAGGWETTQNGVEWFDPHIYGWGGGPNGTLLIDLAPTTYTGGGIKKVFNTEPGEYYLLTFYALTSDDYGRVGSGKFDILVNGHHTDTVNGDPIPDVDVTLENNPGPRSRSLPRAGVGT